MSTGHAHPTEDAAVLRGASGTRMGDEPATERGFTLGTVPVPARSHGLGAAAPGA